MTCLETYSTLRIFSDSMHPSEISQRLGINGVEELPRDLSSQYRPRRETNYWGWCTRPAVESNDGIVHLKFIINSLEPVKNKLRALQDAGCKTDIVVYWVSLGQGGPELSIEIMRGLSALQLPIWWDVYFGNESDYESA